MADAPDLDKLKADLKKLQNDIAALSKQAAAAQAAVETAEVELAEIAETADVYDTSGPKMQDELDDDKTVIAKKRLVAELEVKDLKKKLGEKTKEFGEELKKDGDAAAAAANKAKQAGADADQAVKDLQDKEAAFASLKDQPKATAAKLKELKGLLNEVAKAEAQDDSVAMYFNVVEASALATASPSRNLKTTGSRSLTPWPISKRAKRAPRRRRRISTRSTPLRPMREKNIRRLSLRVDPIC